MNIKGMDREKWSEMIWDAWQQSGIKVDKAEFKEAFAYGEQEMERLQHILPHQEFSDGLLTRMKLELGWLSENGFFPPADVDRSAETVADYLEKQLTKQ